MKNLHSLTELIPLSEREAITPIIPEGETPIWQYWEEFVIQHSRLGKSLETIKSARNGIRVIIRKGKIYSIEQGNNPRLLTQVTLEFQEKYSLRGNTRNTYLVVPELFIRC